MRITEIEISNIRGIDKLIWTPQNGIFPNKPGIVVAPNGMGKTSFAFAFASMTPKRLKPAEEDLHNGDANGNYYVVVRTDDGGVYNATKDKNEIRAKFGVAVLKCNMQPSTTINANGIYRKSRIHIPDIEILGKKPQKPIINYGGFAQEFGLAEVRRGLFPSVQKLFQKPTFLQVLFNVAKKVKRELKVIESTVVQIKNDNRTIGQIHKDFEDKLLPNLENFEKLKRIIDFINDINQDNKGKAGLQAIQALFIGNHEYSKLKDTLNYYDYIDKEKQVREIFRYLKTTWKGIVPKEENGKFILRISDCQRISNGERDTLILIANLCKARIELNKKDNILIIDELFDCLDDANIMVVQYFISHFIEIFKDESRTIFPLILSHLNPRYFNHYSFKDYKVYYLTKLPNPHVSDNILKIIRYRQRNGVDESTKNLISGNLLHFSPNYDDNIDEYNCGVPWHTIKEFKKHCYGELKSYIDNGQYDPLAVCIALREIIESSLFSKLDKEEQRKAFLKTNGTKKKMEKMAEYGKDVPEIFFIMGNLYNNPLHINDKNQESIVNTLYARYENSMIKHIVSKIYNENQLEFDENQ